MEGVRLNMAVVHNADRKTQSWVLSDEAIHDSIVSVLQQGHYDVLGMMIKEKPMLVYPVSQLVGSVGRITEQTAFVHPKHIHVPLSVFLINSQFIECLEGDTLFEKLSSLEVFVDESNIATQLKCMEWYLEHGVLYVNVTGKSI